MTTVNEQGAKHSTCNPPAPAAQKQKGVFAAAARLEQRANAGYEHTVFGCCSTTEKRDECVLATACPCALIRRNAIARARLDPDTDHLESDNESNRRLGAGRECRAWTCCVLGSILGGLCVCSLGALAGIEHTKSRSTLQLPGSRLTDCLCGMACMPCILVQESAELRARLASQPTTDDGGPEAQRMLPQSPESL